MACYFIWRTIASLHKRYTFGILALFRLKFAAFLKSKRFFFTILQTLEYLNFFEQYLKIDEYLVEISSLRESI